MSVTLATDPRGLEDDSWVFEYPEGARSHDGRFRRANSEQPGGWKLDTQFIHNMGSRCPYCTLWADGFNGVVDHLEDRAAFVVVSPDVPEVQAEFAASRNWTFRMASDGSSGFTQAMGFTQEQEGRTYYQPGCSTFRKQDDGTIVRIAQAGFGPGDVYCAPWHLFSLLADSSGDWSPKFSYGE